MTTRAIKGDRTFESVCRREVTTVSVGAPEASRRRHASPWIESCTCGEGRGGGCAVVSTCMHQPVEDRELHLLVDERALGHSIEALKGN